MKITNQRIHYATLLTVAIIAGGWAATLQADDLSAGTNTVVAQRTFATPDEAMHALQQAANAKDPSAMGGLFGPDFSKLLTGDQVQDAKNAEHFATIVAQGCQPVPDGDAKITFELGTDQWPMPIPLVKTNGQWVFDTAAGKEEIINRHVGKDELHAIGVCRAYVTAQRQFALNTANGGNETKYARKFLSASGAKDGLYWPVAANEPASPFGPVVAESQAGNYPGNNRTRPEPFHGYFFKILTRQGPAAPGGKMNYMSHGDLTGGFALVAWPEHWDQSGVMTFIVNQDGKVWQHNFGAATPRVVGAVHEYNPDSNWTLVADEGVLTAALEK